MLQRRSYVVVSIQNMQKNMKVVKFIITLYFEVCV